MLYVCRPQVGNFLLVFKNNYPVCITQRAMRLVALVRGVYVCETQKITVYTLTGQIPLLLTVLTHTACSYCKYCLLIHFICCQRCLLHLLSRTKSAILLISIHEIVYQGCTGVQRRQKNQSTFLMKNMAPH